VSTDFNVSCTKCRKTIHLGTRFTGGSIFGISSKDDQSRQSAIDFITDHLDHGFLLIHTSDDRPDTFHILEKYESKYK
jgi:hypothetical protein